MMTFDLEHDCAFPINMDNSAKNKYSKISNIDEEKQDFSYKIRRSMSNLWQYKNLSYSK